MIQTFPPPPPPPSLPPHRMSTPPPPPPADTRSSVLAVNWQQIMSIPPPFFFFFCASTEGASAHGDVVDLGVNDPADNEIQHNYALWVTSVPCVMRGLIDAHHPQKKKKKEKKKKKKGDHPWKKQTNTHSPAHTARSPHSQLQSLRSVSRGEGGVKQPYIILQWLVLK